MKIAIQYETFKCHSFSLLRRAWREPQTALLPWPNTINIQLYEKGYSMKYWTQFNIGFKHVCNTIFPNFEMLFEAYVIEGERQYQS